VRYAIEPPLGASAKESATLAGIAPDHAPDEKADQRSIRAITAVMGSHPSQVEQGCDVLLRELELRGRHSTDRCDPIAGSVEPLVHERDPRRGPRTRDP